MPIRRGDGTSIAPKGYQEIRLGDGTVLWSGDGSSGGGEQPPDEQNLAARWDFSRVSEMDGAEYTTVSDLSGNGHELDGQGATHTETGINGLPSAQFDGTNASLEGPAPGALDVSSTSATASVYATWQGNSMDNVGGLLSQTINGSGSSREFFQEFTGTLGEVRIFVGGERTIVTTELDTSPHATGALFDREAGSGTFSYDGSTTTMGMGSVGANDIPFRIGARDDLNGTTAHFDGLVGEVLVYDVEHDIATHDEVMAYLSRWTE